MPEQGELFAPPPPVAGFRLVCEAVSEAEEERLAALIDAAPLAPFQFGQWEGKRLTVNYGSAYDYQRARPTEAPPLPDWLAGLRASLAPLMDRSPDDFVQGLLIRYDPGAGIGWHRDRPQYGEVLGLSLSAPALLRLRRRTEGGFDRRTVELPQRSLYLLSGAARHEWEHSITPMEVTRRSITLRTMARGC
jgi:alkylated DNA repair dioxygenase AlkB